MKRAAWFISLCSLWLLSACGPSLEEKAGARIESMTGMTELGTVEYTVNKIIMASDEAFYKIGDRKILFSCRAELKAGIDMSDFSRENVRIDGKSIYVSLPKARLLSFNIPPDGIRQEYQKIGPFRFNFSVEERNNLMAQGEKDILADVPRMGILQEAEASARRFFETVFTRMGFEAVEVRFL